MAREQAEFWSTVAASYDRVVDSQIGGATRAIVRDRAAREGSLGRLVEFGCGTGFYTDVLAGKASTVLATDIAPGMLEIAKRRVQAPNVIFQVEDCQGTSLPAGAFDTAFLGLVIHFTAPMRTMVEMGRILRPGGTVVILNLDRQSLRGVARMRSTMRILYHGVSGYRTKPPTRFGRDVLNESELRAVLQRSGFGVASVETFTDPSSAANVPIQYVRAVKV